MLGAEIRQRPLLLDRPDPTAGIVRRTEDDDLLLPRERRGKGVEIHLETALFELERAFVDPPAVGFDDLGEGMVDGREKHDALARLAEGLKADREPRDDAVGGRDPLRLHLPVVPALHPSGNRGGVGRVVAVVAVHAMRGQFVQRLVHRRGRAEIHVRNPHGQPVIRRDAKALLDRVPFAAMGPAPVNHLVEIEHATPQALNCHRSSAPRCWSCSKASCQASEHRLDRRDGDPTNSHPARSAPEEGGGTRGRNRRHDPRAVRGHARDDV